MLSNLTLHLGVGRHEELAGARNPAGAARHLLDGDRAFRRENRSGDQEDSPRRQRVDLVHLRHADVAARQHQLRRTRLRAVAQLIQLIDLTQRRTQRPN